jgi:hypothetical protein
MEQYRSGKEEVRKKERENTAERGSAIAFQRRTIRPMARIPPE